MMKDLNDLLNEAKKIQKKEPDEINNFIQKSSVKPPDAIVLVKVIVTCKYCLMKYTYPNLHLLMRRDRQRLKIKNWRNEYYYIPREIFIVEESSDVCEKCFHSDKMVIEDETVQVQEAEESEERKPPNAKVFRAMS